MTCGSGTMTRRRSCDSPSPVYGGSNCTGVSVETVTCKFDDCIGKYFIYLDECLWLNSIEPFNLDLELIVLSIT